MILFVFIILFVMNIFQRKHPDMPRRPLTTYMIYYLKKKAKVQAENPFLEMVIFVSFIYL